MTSTRLDALSTANGHFSDGQQRRLFFKCEHLQKTGSFKVRGALNAVRKLRASQPQLRCVVTHSSGNHGQALAWAAACEQLACVVVVPEGTPSVKTRAIEGYGAELVWCAATPAARESTCAAVAQQRAAAIVPPFDHADVMAGQGTLGLELLHQTAALGVTLDAVLVCVSGGGLSAGVATAVKARLPGCRVLLVAPQGKQLGESLAAGARLWRGEPRFLDTVAEAIRLQQPGQLTFPVLCALAEHKVISVADADMAAGCRLAAADLKQVVEAAAGAAVAAAVLPEHLPADVLNVGVILCGGNTDVDRLPWYPVPL